MKQLEDQKLYVLDMDGTIYLGSRLFPETIPVVFIVSILYKL